MRMCKLGSLKKMAHGMLVKMTYKAKHEKALQEFCEKKEKYLHMSEDEFSVDYIAVKARCEYKKMKFFIFSVLLITSILLNIWKYILDVICVLLTANTKLMPVEASKVMIMCFLAIGIAVLVFCLPILYYTLYTLHALLKEKLLLEEIRKMRNSGNLEKGKEDDICQQ